jgi:arsenate reductase
VITLYGIKNCDTCRKARKWLTDEGIEHKFHDFRVDGLDEATVGNWAAELGWETLLNRRGTTWRKIPEADREGVDGASAAKLMTDNPTLIKRPVFDLGASRVVGFSDDARAAIRQAS